MELGLSRKISSPTIPEAPDRKFTDDFAGLWQRIAISSIIKDDLAYDAYCPSVDKDITRRQCQDCNIYFTGMTAVQRHRQGKCCPSRDCVYIPKEVLDDVEEFGSDDCLMHGDNELCDTALVINILSVCFFLLYTKFKNLFLIFTQPRNQLMLCLNFDFLRDIIKVWPLTHA